jgi:hypothetical protein
MLNGRVQCGPMSILRRSMDRRVKPGDDELFGCRDAPSHPSFAQAKKSQAKKEFPRSLLQTRREAERREAHQPEPHRQAMRRAPSLLSSHCGRTEAQDFIEPWTSKNGAGALAFRRPTAASEVLASARLRPRFLESPDANGRTLSGTSAASTSQSDTCRTGRCPSRPRAQCMAALHENRSRSALRSTLAKGVPLRAGCWVYNCNRNKVKGNVALLGTRPRLVL